MNSQIAKAAQTRAATAVAMSNPLLWDEAKAMYRIAVQRQDSSELLGMARPYRKIMVADAEINFEAYGDFVICDGDKLKANLAVNLELPSEAFSS
ncbi:hypothetical protein [Enterobacter bugandensis]|uniref:hypothetical protein n=1 Tax=Enterobacter bugandensis TaxID=881260 RepID=UPI0021D09DA1|nr:hypothetical protein [Enterobacter bugandensis]MCU6214473.1 hypothetical protein [Enterobacter bugandensis]